MKANVTKKNDEKMRRNVRGVSEGKMRSGGKAEEEEK